MKPPLTLGAVALATLALEAADAPPRDAQPTPNTRAAAVTQQELPHYEYNGRWTFVRIRTSSGRRGFGRFRRFRGGWSHDYPNAERNFTRIVEDMTLVPTRIEEYGGNVLTFDDPRLHQYPIAYVSEPGDWAITPEEATALREYLLKGGFVIFDDFFEREMQNVFLQTSFVLPDLSWIEMDGTEAVWRSFFSLEPLEIELYGPRKNGRPRWWGLFEGNDRHGRMLAIAGAGADIGDLWEWSATGYFPVDPTNEAYQIGINYIVYALAN